MKIFKKIISTILASAMCIPTSIMSVAYAAETDTLGGYTVTLTDTENGVMQFSEECKESSTAEQNSYHMLTINEDGELEETDNDGSVWAFSSGDVVEIELIPDDDYEVSSLSIKNANTGKELAHEDTTDNVFSFVMPAKSVTVEATFKEIQTDNDDADTDTDADTDDSSYDGPVNEENNIVEENEYGEIVYKRIELTDDEAITLQERIDNLPTAEDLYSSLYNSENDYVSEVEAEVDDIKEIYFNELTDNERAQIDSSLLFSSLLTLNAGDFTPKSDEIPSDTKLEELQERIDALDNVRDISEAEDTDENYVVYDYGSDESGMLIPNEDQDELFLEVMELSEEVFLLEAEDQMKLDTENLEEMYRFFTGGNPEMDTDDGIMTMSLNDGIMLLADEGSDDPDMQGWYARSKVSQKYNAAYYSGILDDDGEDKREIVLYCGDASKKTYVHEGGHVSFAKGQNVEEIKKSPENITSDNLVRAILYYGYKGPGYENGEGLGAPGGVATMSDGVTTMSLITTTNKEDKMVCAMTNTSIEGMDVQKYMITHFALSMAFSGQPGRAQATTGNDAKNFMDFCNAMKGNVPSSFRVFMVTPTGEGYQPMFYFVNPNTRKVNPKGPFNMWLFKTNSQEGYEYKASSLAGAEFTVKYYAAEMNDDGSTNKESLILSQSRANSTDAVPTATFTFETKLLYPNNGVRPGNEGFQKATDELVKRTGYTAVAGIEFAPYIADENVDQEDVSNGIISTDTVWTNQFLTSDLMTYNEYYGGPGTYVIYETRAPQGYNLSGTMAMPMAGYTFETTNLQTGVAFSMYWEWDTSVATGEPVLTTKYFAENYEMVIQQDTDITLKVTDQETMEKTDVTFKKTGGTIIHVDERPVVPDFWSHAASVDTGTQWADPESTNIQLEDEVFIETYDGKEAKYVIDTRLYDLTAGKFVSFNSSNAHSYDPTDETAVYRYPWDNVFTDSGSTSLALAQGRKSAFEGMFGPEAPNGIITNEFNTRNDIEPGQTYELKVKCSIDGTQGGANGLRGHTLVFINVITVFNGYKGDVYIGGGGYDADKGAPFDPGAAILYQYPTTRIHKDRIEEEGNYLSELDVALRDSEEMIFITRSSTSILSSQTKRKRNDDEGLGESIIYAGMYLDDSFKSGGGAIKQTLTDTVKYENLQPNRTYNVKGYLVDRETGSLATDAYGTPIQNTENTIKQQSSASGKGEWKIEYSFDATGCGNRVYVSYVEVYLGNELVLEYKQQNDMHEAFFIPQITTKLWDDKTGVDLSYADDTIKVHDTITYKKLLPGTKYKIESRLINMATGETLLDINGDPVVSEQTKTISLENGTITVDFEFPAVIRNEKGEIEKSLAGTTFVAYEKIYIEQEKEGSGKWVLVADHEDFNDENQRIYMPFIDTTALDQKTGAHISYAEKNMKIYDTVHYEALRPEYTYKLVSELRDAATGEIIVDDAGNRQTLVTYFKADFDLQDNQYLTYGDIIPENHDGSGITFDVDAEFFAGRTLVIYERLYIENDYGTGDHLIAEHQELLDEDQTIHVPKVWTSAIDSDTFTKTSFADGSTTIIDTFSYENLIPGFTYELKGYVLDQHKSITTGTNVITVGTDGKLAQNSLIFTPESSAGAVRLSFEVDTRKFNDGEDYNGMIFVVYEELYVIQRYDGDDARSIVASHTDIADLNQTVYVPRITTNLNDKKTGTKILNAETDSHLVDTISYYRFQPNTEYIIKGKLLDMQTGNVLTDTKGKRLEETLTVMSSDTGTGSWTVDYEFDSTGMKGKIVVAYADVYVRNGERNDILSHVASHNDFWDESQRVYIPLISTVATDQKTNSHITYVEENVWVTDRISYSFLKPNQEYRLISRLVDKDTGETVVDDKGIEQVIESDFVTTPNEPQEKYNQIISNPLTGNSSDIGIGYSYGYIIPADGTTLPDGTQYRGVVFTFDAHTFEGRTLTIFEELQIRTADGSYMTVAKHTDISDENQTVHIPRIVTNAVDSETLTHSSKMDGSMTIIDTVKYENLIPGFTYILEGCLMDKPRDDTKGYGKIKDKDGNYITNRIEFTPDRPDGEVKLSLSGNAGEFQTDEGAFSSETLVVFERLYLKNSKDASDELLIVARHEDINDEKQTIYCPRISTKVVSYDLGEESKDGDADHVIGFTAYECSYCKTRFYTEKETKTHIESNIKCRNMQAKVNTVTEATIYDRVYYENLIPNRTYSMVGHLIDTKTGKAVLINQRAVQSEEKYFTPGTQNGEVDVVFHVTGIDLAGGRYVVYEELFLDGVSIAEHKDFFDENQTFYVPRLVTSAYDINTGTNIAKNDTKSTIIDEVQISGLKEGQNYYLSSVLMDKETESQFIDGSGKAVNAVAWRKKGDSVWNYYNSSNGNGDKYFTIGQTLSAENYRGTITINTNGSSSGSDIDNVCSIENGSSNGRRTVFLTIMDGI